MIDFDVEALHAALDARRRERGLTWAQTASAISALFRDVPARPISASTLTGMRGRRVLEGNGVLQVLLWLGRSPESFVPGAEVTPPLAQLPVDRILRFDPRLVHTALESRRAERGLTWKMVAEEIGGVTPGSLTRMSRGGHIGFPDIVRIARWLGCPIATFTGASAL